MSLGGCMALSGKSARAKRKGVSVPRNHFDRPQPWAQVHPMSLAFFTLTRPRCSDAIVT